jgi:hypothetical protein
MSLQEARQYADGLADRRSSGGEAMAYHQSGIFLVMSRQATIHAPEPTVARTIRFPAELREKIAADAERCGRSFDGQVIALLRRHYGEDVDIAPSPAEIIALAVASLADVPCPTLGIDLRLRDWSKK